MSVAIGIDVRGTAIKAGVVCARKQAYDVAARIPAGFQASRTLARALPAYVERRSI